MAFNKMSIAKARLRDAASILNALSDAVLDLERRRVRAGRR